MGTITIIEYSSIGGPGATDGSPVANLSTALKTTTDSTTSTSSENITLQPDTRYISVYGAELHRVSLKDSTVADRYALVTAGNVLDFAVNKSDRTLYYRADA